MSEVGILRKTLGGSDGELRNVKQELAESAREIGTLQKSLGILERRIEEHAGREALLNRILASHSWRMTRPLRFAGRLLRGEWALALSGARRALHWYHGANSQISARPPRVSKSRQPKILCHINHYFGSTSKFVGRSTAGATQIRERVVKTAIARIQSLPFEIDIRICGFPREALVPVDIDLSTIGEPRWIVYESIERMFASVDDYDCFLNIEDDILVNDDFVANSLAFNSVSEVNEVFLPNRMEQRAGGAMACVDLEAMPGWAGLNREFLGTILDVAINPHSGLFLLTRRQMRYAADRISLDRREQFHGGYMASAYANMHSPFLAWRAKSNPMAHYVVHGDNWMGPRGEPTSTGTR